MRQRIAAYRDGSTVWADAGQAARVSRSARITFTADYYALSDERAARRSRLTTHLGGPMDAIVQDLRYAARSLRRQPAFALLAIATLALGIGANTAIFSAVNAVLLRPLPYRDPDRIVTVWEKRQAEGVNDNVVSPADFLDWARMNQGFEAVAAMTTAPVDLLGSGEPEQLFAGVVSPAFFDILRVQPMLERTFRSDEA